MLREIFASVSEAQLGITVMLFFLGFFTVVLFRVFSPANSGKYARIAQLPLEDRPNHEAQ